MRKETQKTDTSKVMLDSWASLETILDESSNPAYRLRAAASDLLVMDWPNVLERSRRNTEATKPLIFMEMIAFAQRIGPAKFVEVNRHQTTIAGWSGLLLDTWKNIRALDKSNPDFDDLKRMYFRLFEHSVSQLGVEILMPLLVNEAGNTTKELENYNSFPQQINKRREGYVVIVKQGAAASFAQWQPDRNIGAIAVNREELHEVLEMFDRVEGILGKGSLMLDGDRKLFLISDDPKGERKIEARAYIVGTADHFKASDWSTLLDMFRPDIKPQELGVPEGNLSEIYHSLTINEKG